MMEINSQLGKHRKKGKMLNKAVQFAGKRGVAFLLAMLMGVALATPALAWFPQEAELTIRCLPCRVMRGDSGQVEVHQFKRVPQPCRHVVKETPLLHPVVARAEMMWTTIE